MVCKVCKDIGFSKMIYQHNNKAEHDFLFHSKIKPCPFCGAIPQLIHNTYKRKNGNREHSYTFACHCGKKTKTMGNLGQAIKAWEKLKFSKEK